MGLWIVPGESVVWFVVSDSQGGVHLEAVTPAQFIETLCALGTLHRFRHRNIEAPDPEELLPWAGNV